MGVKRISFAAILVVLFFLCNWYFLHTYQFSFNYQPAFQAGYLIPVVAGAIIFINQAWLIRRPAGYFMTPFEAAVWILLMLLLAGVCINASGMLFSNEHLMIVIFMLSVWNVTRIGLTIDVVSVLVAGILFFFFYQLFIVLGQILQGQEAVGTFGNSGVVSCYLIVHFPLTVYVSGKLRNRILSASVIVSIALLLLIILIITHSRTAITGIFVGAGVWLLYRYKMILLPRRKKWYIPALLLLSVTAFVGLIQFLLSFKKASADGRILKLVVTSQHIPSHWFLGIGLGNFSFYYPGWQMQYIKQAKELPERYFLNAGDSFLLFNEPLQFYMETGVLGMLSVVFVLLSFFRLNSDTHPQLMRAIQFTVLLMLLCSFTTYLFHITAIVFLLTILAAIAYAIKDDRTSIWAKPFRIKKYQPLIGLMLLVSAGFVYAGAHRYYLIKKWNYQEGNQITIPVGKPEYHEMTAALKNEGKLLLMCAESLVANRLECQEAVRLCELSKKTFISYETYKTTAEAYECLAQYQSAISNYLALNYLVPSRFYPKQKLANLYLATGQKDKAMEMAHKILAMPVKYPSDETDAIRIEMRALLERVH